MACGGRTAVFCTADDAYVYPSVVALESAKRFHPEADYFIIGNRSSISGEKLDLLDALGIGFIHSDMNLQFGCADVWPDTAYLALFGPEILGRLGYDFSLGLDGDTLCVSSLDLDAVFARTACYAGIVNRDAWWNYFDRNPFIRERWNFSDDQLAQNSTNTGVVFWNNRAAEEMEVGRRAVELYRELIAGNVRVMGDQALLALIAMVGGLPFEPLDYPYNYRVGNESDMKIEPVQVRIFHYTAQKPWIPWRGRSWRDRFRKPAWLRHHKPWHDFVEAQGYFTSDLRLKRPVSKMGVR